MKPHEKEELLEWLYINDGAHPNRTEWRIALVEKLDEMVNQK